MEIEIPDNEDAACDLDILEPYFVRIGWYEQAGMISGAARRLRADAEEIARLELKLSESESTIGVLKHLIGEQADQLAASEAKCAELRAAVRSAFDQQHIRTLDCLDLRESIATLRAAVEERERAIVWAAKAYAATIGRNPPRVYYTPPIEINSRYSVDYDGTDADLIRVVLEQSKGGE